eukprot:CAMPEP_0169124640 /NCGR_PEP_ID=MMETSP1015-20121227/34433_1 /TAXON_ID=342587 /ORGANISM="Karlodinium micrum, Strain CCMP2283" /LENGTH=152 /DNA_ID=CAMNT_0009188071 /DNA_START=73 /DNA_END=531 /DNA_ORIENTATION=+
MTSEALVLPAPTLDTLAQAPPSDYDMTMLRPPRHSMKLCEGVTFNSVAREWRCKWSEGDNKKSLTECQRVLMEIAVPKLKHVHGVLSVQRVVCTDCKDFKIIVKLNIETFEDWVNSGLEPENSVLNALWNIQGVSEVDAQTYTVQPIYGAGK